MITKINRLKGFGIFEDFKWNGLGSFKKKNLIYGWNYSGKTTFSKLFQNLEFKDKNRNFQGAEFEIIITKEETSSSHSQDDIENFDFEVKVFNAEYIKRVFTWDIPNSDIEPISFYLGDPSGELDKKIKHLDRKVSQLKNIRDNRYLTIINDFDNYNKSNGKFSAKAKDIRENYLGNRLDQNKLHKGTILQITNAIKGDLEKHILSEKDRDKTKEEAVTENTFETQKDDYSFNENIERLKNSVKTILEDTAPKSISFPELDKNKTLFDWVQTGIKLHQNETECKFCTKELPDNRISNLNSYYSKKLKEIQNAIKDTNEAIQIERDALEKITFPDKKNLGNSFQNDYQKAINDFKETIKKYKVQLTTLEKDLKRKESDYFNNIPATDIESISLKKDLNEVNKSVKSHNDWISEFDKNKKTALNKILNHYVAEFLKNENYNQKEKEKDRASTIITSLNSRIEKREFERQQFEIELKSNVKGQEELNTTLKILLHRNDIKIEIKNNKFTLERSGRPANNLSEGEKSAIAFAYFLTELKALRNDNPPKLPNTIIFIDDPISSLDSNHIFQVRSLLQNFLKEDDYAQLFISTHNFEFFSVMLDTNLFGYKNKDKNGNKRPLYFIKRFDNNTSEIQKLPLSFSSYKSEYVGLFHIIKEFNELENKDGFPNLLILPNAVRRFMELYTLMKYPTNKEIDNRVSQVFNPDDNPTHNTKLLHWFSHQNQFEKVQQHDDKIFQIEDAISELMKHIEQNDKLHWQGLNEIANA